MFFFCVWQSILVQPRRVFVCLICFRQYSSSHSYSFIPQSLSLSHRYLHFSTSSCPSPSSPQQITFRPLTSLLSTPLPLTPNTHTSLFYNLLFFFTCVLLSLFLSPFPVIITSHILLPFSSPLASSPRLYTIFQLPVVTFPLAVYVTS